VDAQSFQQRVMSRLGEFPTDEMMLAAFTTLIREASATRTLVALDGDGDKVTDDDLVGHFGALFLALTEAACVLGVDLERAMQWGERAAEARAVTALVSDTVLVSTREACRWPASRSTT
jgi:hypothetical protein